MQQQDREEDVSLRCVICELLGCNWDRFNGKEPVGSKLGLSHILSFCISTPSFLLNINKPKLTDDSDRISKEMNLNFTIREEVQANLRHLNNWPQEI